ncbi:EF-hand [Xylona heveae TC161]|uniref:EF-hand n=1 Tax=Xylona heveae (strain CBS 132557 / TC161) TaxID=1328760 RepID=A0A165JF27_XYLHT|nr:EF-hand [Xylona heveae TC161]KZF26153.1 EF-hand [Xylona heveae TC161]
MQQGPPSNGGRGRGSGYGSAGYSQGPPPAGAVPPTAGGPPPHARYGSVSSPPLQPEDFSRPPPQQRYNNYGFSPPPQHQAFGAPPPPPQGYHNRPPVSSRPPSSPIVARDASEASLIPLFQAVDKNGSGELSERELGAALINGDWTPFDPHTVRMMIRMFDSDRDGTIGFSEFCGLWNFLASWRALFDRFDEDRSGNISFDEYSKALVAFGYRLTPQFVQTLFRTYDKRGANAISFDVFVQSCISLKRMTDVFKKYDDDRDGYITLSLYVSLPSPLNKFYLIFCLPTMVIPFTLVFPVDAGRLFETILIYSRHFFSCHTILVILYHQAYLS